MVDRVDLVEVVRVGVGNGQVAKRRLWSGGELLATGDCKYGSGSTSEAWVGVTNSDDLEVARHRIAELRAGLFIETVEI